MLFKKTKKIKLNNKVIKKVIDTIPLIFINFKQTPYAAFSLQG